MSIYADSKTEIVLFDGVVSSKVLLSAEKVFDMTDKLRWRKETYPTGDECGVLTLSEIWSQLQDEWGVVYVIVNEPLHATIYQCGNYADADWILWGEGLGYA